MDQHVDGDEGIVIEVTQHGSWARIRLDRPEALNALDDAAVQELVAAVAALDSDPAVRAIIVTGAGERAFSAGADIHEFAAAASPRWTPEAGMQAAFQVLQSASTPSIAAVNGYALGGGLELALACDLRIAADTATFALPELGLSVLPAAGGVTRLTRLIGPGRALELMLSGRRMDAAEALRIGLVTSIHSAEELDVAADALAQTVAARAPLAVHLARRAVQAGQDASLDTALLLETLGQAVLTATDDFREGVTAFAQKRTPRFEGR